MTTCPRCQAGGDACRCGSPVMLTVALTPDQGPGVARFDSRYPAAPLTPPPDRPLGPGGVALAVSTPPPAAPVVVRLRVIRGHRADVEFPVFPGRNVIGRFADQPVDIDLTGLEPDGQVWSSRRHAALTLDRALLVAEDLNSLNGTWVNGTRLRAGLARPLQAGDVIQIGVVQLRVHVEKAPAAADH